MWLESLFREESTTRTFSIALQPKFDQVFKNHFFSINTTAEAVNKLEATSYYQESCIVEDYLDEF